MTMDIECAGFTFISNFDSGNLAKVELVEKKGNNSGKIILDEVPDFEFNIWTRPDCSGTDFENSNRTWFYFGVKGGAPYALIKINIVNLNKQSKMYSQGMAPVYRMVPGRNSWDRIKEKPTFVIEDNVFILSFKYRTLENLRAVTYFAFTYPFTYVDLQNMLNVIDNRLKVSEVDDPQKLCLEDIYYHRECVCYSLERRRIDLITVSSHHSISSEREPRLKDLFPDVTVPRPFRFIGKKVVFISARVHPGETPSSFVFNGLLNLILNRDDPIAILLRKNFVFKLIPMLNPDGVSKGHYRTDTRGVNLNRVYLNPSLYLHPSVFAARALIRYYHYGQEVEDSFLDTNLLDLPCSSSSDETIQLSHSDDIIISQDKTEDKTQEEQKDFNIENQVSGLSLDDKNSNSSQTNSSNFETDTFVVTKSNLPDTKVFSAICDSILKSVVKVYDGAPQNFNSISIVSKGLPDGNFVETNNETPLDVSSCSPMTFLGEPVSCVLENIIELDTVSSGNYVAKCELNIDKDFSTSSLSFNNSLLENCKGGKISAVGIGKSVDNGDSGLYLYVDLHGHASKKGIFMYGNYFDSIDDSIECMLLPKIMALNNQNFHFTACNFTERNMYLRDRRDGMSREGSGRVAVLKTTGLVRSYTLECNYNTGRLVNSLPPSIRENIKSTPVHMIPPKYTPQIFEEVGRALGVSILDLSGHNPWSRIPNSEFRSISGIRDWLKSHCLSHQNFVHKNSRVPRQNRNPPNSQVVCVGAKVQPRPSSSSTTTSKNISRVRRLAPIPQKTSDKVAAKIDRACSENAVEERKENLSSYIVSASPDISSNVKFMKSFPCPKQSVSSCSSQRCSSMKKTKSGQNSGILKQVLAVRTKCSAVSALSGGSKSGTSMTNIRTLSGVVGIKKSNQVASTSTTRVTKLKTSKSFHENNVELYMAESELNKRQFKKIVSGRIGSSCDRVKVAKNEQKCFSDDSIIKHGSKRLKITPIKQDLNPTIDLLPESYDVKGEYISPTNKDISFIKINEQTNCFSNFSSCLEDSSNFVYVDYSGSTHKMLDETSTKQPGVSGTPKSSSSSCSGSNKQLYCKYSSPNLCMQSKVFKSEVTSVVPSCRSKSATKAEKQGKNKISHLSPIKHTKKSPSFSKKSSSEYSKKRSKVTLKNLASTSGKLRKSISAELNVDKKRKKTKTKFT